MNIAAIVVNSCNCAQQFLGTFCVQVSPPEVYEQASQEPSKAKTGYIVLVAIITVVALSVFSNFVLII